jgi:hypothetical protein
MLGERPTARQATGSERERTHETIQRARAIGIGVVEVPTPGPEQELAGLEVAGILANR